MAGEIGYRGKKDLPEQGSRLFLPEQEPQQPGNRAQPEGQKHIIAQHQPGQHLHAGGVRLPREQDCVLPLRLPAVIQGVHFGNGHGVDLAAPVHRGGPGIENGHASPLRVLSGLQTGPGNAGKADLDLIPQFPDADQVFRIGVIFGLTVPGKGCHQQHKHQQRRHGRHPALSVLQLLFHFFQALAAVHGQRLCFFHALLQTPAVGAVLQVVLHQRSGLLAAQLLGIQRQKIPDHAAGDMVHCSSAFLFALIFARAR